MRRSVRALRGGALLAGLFVSLAAAGEGLRFDEMAARAGVYGILRVMRAKGMIAAKGIARPKAAPVRCGGWSPSPA